MTKQVQRRRGTTAQHTGFTGAEGEISVNTTNKSIHVHDGATAGGIEAARADLDNVTTANVTSAISGGTISSITLTTPDINGGTADNVTIGGSTPAAGTFTTATATTGNITTVNATTVDTTNIEVTNVKAKDGTASATIADSTGVMTIASSVLTTTDINGGTIDGVTIGGASAGAGTFTTLGATGDVTITDKIIHSGDTNTAIRFPAADTVTVETAGTERMRIDSSGNLLVGHTYGTNIFGTSQNLSSSINLFTMRASANAFGPLHAFVKSRSASLGSFTIVQSGDTLGRIYFAGDDGVDYNSIGASIEAFVDGTPGSNDMPGRLVFSTTADGASTATERMRITNAGNVVIGATTLPGVVPSGATRYLNLSGGFSASPQAIGMTMLSGADGAVGHLYFNGHSSGGNPRQIASISGYQTGTTVAAAGGYLAFNTNVGSSEQPTERMRIDSSGMILPGADNTQDLGSSTKRWNDLFVGGSVYLGGTTSANALDDYEEGTFTCSITIDGVDGTGTAGDGQARYVKVGDLVMINVQRRQSGYSAVNEVGTLTITGSLPFTADEGFAIRVSNRALSMDGDAFLKVNSGSSAIYSRSSDGSNDYNNVGNTVTVADNRSIKVLEFSAVYKAQ